MKMAAMVALQRKWTYSDYLELDNDKRYEIIGGELRTMPAPNLHHQDIVRDLGLRLWSYVQEKDLGIIYLAPTDVLLGEYDVVQPDIVFVSKQRKNILQ